MQRKVLLLIPHPESGGGVPNYYRALDLERLDERVQYFFVNTASPESRPRTVLRLLTNYWRFWRMLADRRYEWVLANPSLSPRSFYRDAVFCWLAFLKGKRVALFFRGWSEEFETAIRTTTLPAFVFRRTFGRVEHFIVLGRAFRDKLIGLGCRADSRFWIETTVADARYLADFSIAQKLRPPDRWQILFMSRLLPAKGARVAIEAFRIAKARCPDLDMTLLVAGDGSQLPELRRLVEERRIEGVRFVGAVSGKHRKHALLRSNVLLFPSSHDEGMPNVILEAMLYGMPVLSRRNGSIPEHVEHGTHGFLTASTDPEVFAGWIVSLVRDPGLYRKMVLANHEWSLRHCTTARVRDRFRRILAELLETPPGGTTEVAAGAGEPPAPAGAARRTR